ncbi:iron-containing alcohol dehydrogenase family protein [Natronorubrum daqingense]|uniref:Alcohol dehydrogenase n=1 Tax=Natronorubrum daqingense TaxID=588898 RepID=A0A1N6Z030_9EURY|nr:iron-containing alcohol dehydrogenase family protein [Natronorubrum daqingense]APX95505.1 alcohol dehydrogenase [Natronorubrum daqingense]SIR20193.1 Alcohol dehydrogenase, class IV [Natronorubrum daqingense]
MTPVDATDGREPTTRFEYEPSTIRLGPNCVDDLEDELAANGFERALVVCGSTVGRTPDVIGPVTDGIGDRLVGVFDETTPKKRLATAANALERLEAERADVLVSLGGGSSLDVAKAASVLAASDRPTAEIADEFARTETITVPDEGLVPIVAVPTTLAGADLSMSAGVTAGPESGLVDTVVEGGISHPGLMPAAAVYDPTMLETTPETILAGSAMNGFDKGIETLYSAAGSPVTDATARHGLEKLADGLRAFGDGARDIDTYQTLLEGIVLVQYGISRADGSTLSIVHAFGHGLTRTYSVQQGAAHAVVVPHVLEYLFEQDDVDARAGMLADALGVENAADHGSAVVEAVTEIRDALGLPACLRNVDGPEPDEFEAVATHILSDRLMANTPPGLEPTVDDIDGILERAW